MTTSEILMLVSAIFTAIAAIAAAVSCFLHYRSLKPRIKLHGYKDSPTNFYINDNEFSCAFIGIDIANNSSVSGTIEDIYIKINKVKYNVENEKLKYVLPAGINFITKLGTKVTIEELRIKCPILVEGYTVKEGIVVIPGLPKLGSNHIFVALKYKVTGNLLPRRVKKIKLKYDPK